MTIRILSKETLGDYNAREQDNLILIDKPPDWTSFDVVKKIRNIGRFRKVGHAGTLDPFATGLLVLGTEKYTRRLQTVTASDKVYEGVIVFGEERDTCDITGKIVRTVRLDRIDPALVDQKVSDMTGASEQVPPMYSARKIGGQRLYAMARKGIEVAREPRPVFINAFRVTEYGDRSISFYIECSKGTYIRTVAHDLGQACGYGAYLSSLRRVAVDGFDVTNALTIDEFQHFWKALN